MVETRRNFLKDKEEIQSSLRKYNKTDWLNHIRSLKNIHEKTSKIDEITKILDSRIRLTKSLQDSIVRNKDPKSIWSILNEELITLNRLLSLLEEEKTLSKEAIKLFKYITSLAKVEEVIILNTL